MSFLKYPTTSFFEFRIHSKVQNWCRSSKIQTSENPGIKFESNQCVKSLLKFIIEVQIRRCHMIGHKERQHRQYRQYLSVDIGFNSLRSVYFSLISSPRKLLWCLLCYCLVIINGHRRHSKTRRELVKYRCSTEFSFLAKFHICEIWKIFESDHI